jgi:predicted metal-binding protein
LPYLEVNLKDIIFDPKVQTYCINSNFKCPSYGHSWACPPEAPYLEQELMTYERFFLIFTKFNLKIHIETQKVKQPKKSKETLLNAFFMKNFLRDNLEREIYLFLDEIQNQYSERLVLWDGFCRLCYNEKEKGCTYDSGDPCRYPEEKRYSMEAVGIDVTKTVRNLNFNLEWPPNEFIYRFGLVCLKY